MTMFLCSKLGFKSGERFAAFLGGGKNYARGHCYARIIYVKLLQIDIAAVVLCKNLMLNWEDSVDKTIINEVVGLAVRRQPNALHLMIYKSYSRAFFL